METIGRIVRRDGLHGEAVNNSMQRRGYTIMEITVVLALAAVVLGISGLYMADFLTRSAPRRAAQIFSRDLAQARAFATRSRESVTVTFLEDSLLYQVESEGGRVLASRRFRRPDDITLHDLDLELDGDTLHFDGRGLAALSGLGIASFSVGNEVYEVRFNGTGSSRVARR